MICYSVMLLLVTSDYGYNVRRLLRVEPGTDGCDFYLTFGRVVTNTIFKTVSSVGVIGALCARYVYYRAVVEAESGTL